MITKEEYLKAKAIVDKYEQDNWEESQRQADEELNWEEEMFDEPCSVCGETNGYTNPCCPDYDPDCYENCGYD